MGVLQALLGQQRYAEAAAEAASEPDDAETAPLAASAGLFSCAVLAEPGALADAIARAERVGVAAGELELYRHWGAQLADQPPAALSAAALEPALAALEALLHVREFVVFEQLVTVYERVDVSLEQRRARLAELYLRCGYTDSAEDEWHRGARDADSLVGLAQVALVREQPAEAAALATTALGLDPASQSARRLVSALTQKGESASIPGDGCR
jgi:hypothetical protein